MNLSHLKQSGPYQTRILLVVTVGLIATVGSALAFEHIGGYAPCALCLEQRTPYYIGIPFALVGLIAAALHWPACIIRGMLMIALACLIATALLGAYHSGVEWGFWAGPESCSASITGGPSDAGSLLQDLATAKPPSCDEAAGRFLGISFAGWNVIAALFFAVFAWRGSFGKRTA